MNPAALPLLRFPVGIVVERHKAGSAWTDFVWRAVAVLPDEPGTRPWTVLREEDGTTLFYAGSATVDLYPSETARYRDNLASGSPSIWTVLSPAESAWPYSVTAATADPSEGEAFTEAGANLVEAVPMPEMLREAIESFVAEHHVEREFFKRKRRQADPEALARRQHEGGRNE
ncbi:hypothetical protein ABIF65_004248 [Bradyrhizobium japonicum]|uniref:DUF3305 domain-containing protein n=1 Tax=Bradyrhizobium TaxID=374 RepID=UPI0004215972|nr:MULTISPECIES: DUF3305 domain-containing protein [Bradyrhizobium]MBR0879806.1 DUF3305 domain-containing protein [Bradyrhizobium liaoningense]MBR1000004.1 DUF3305 domain-containing protein [Bradyrhizobium liaoningense]MBR1028928.1 DUF3305 domain-containing protein [Bradyrhizobium liaoningense]MBR1067177.1 DUF3305 domain-containing protein [Bradyrhizobium liaoningense]MCP1742563.1 hypothetical protein [Bradyrhizobium japonicum]